MGVVGSVWACYLYGEQVRLSAAGGGLDGSLNSNLAVRDVAAHPSRSGGGWLVRSPRPPKERRSRIGTCGAYMFIYLCDSIQSSL